VASNWPGVVPWSVSRVSQCFHCHSGCSLDTLVASISASGECRCPPSSPPKYGHSTWRGEGCAAKTRTPAPTSARQITSLVTAPAKRAQSYTLDASGRSAPRSGFSNGVKTAAGPNVPPTIRRTSQVTGSGVCGCLREVLTMEHRFRRPGHDAEFKCDFHILRFSDEGNPDPDTRVKEIVDCIETWRQDSAPGVVVVVFIHGWHHNADPDDTHLKGFREVVEAITVREWEVVNAVRPVIGVYVGWNGDPIGGWSAIKRVPVLKHVSFWRRYRTAHAIGMSRGFQEALAKIISAAKAPPEDRRGNPTVESALVLAGHSMGSLMLQSALLELLHERLDSLLFKTDVPDSDGPTEVRTLSDGVRVFFPDLLLCLNSAADSEIAQGIINKLNWEKMKRRAETRLDHVAINYDAPLFVSITSTDDKDTRRTWRWARLSWRKGWTRRTDGHDSTLFTHTMTLQSEPARCAKRGGVPDFGQAWHCLHLPQPLDTERPERPSFPIDLPKGAREGSAELEHERWLLAPQPNARNASRVAWIFQVPGTISKDHGDIFQTRTSALFMAMLQVSGAVVGLSHTFAGNFERAEAEELQA